MGANADAERELVVRILRERRQGCIEGRFGSVLGLETQRQRRLVRGTLRVVVRAGEARLQGLSGPAGVAELREGLAVAAAGPRVLRVGAFISLTEYAADFDIPVAFPPERLRNVFGEYVSGLGLRQLRIAETEKYAHVTFFFNGGREEPFSGALAQCGHL